jgi:phospholipase A1
MLRNFVLSVFLLSLVICTHIHSQTILIRKDTVESIFRRSPPFTIFKDNYFISGAPLGTTPTSENADAKFQISFKQRLFDKPLPFGIFAHIIFTQKSFWDIYRESLPFRETNYNPGLFLVKPIFQNDLLRGVAIITVEHESNGRDSIFSRSWNFVSVEYAHIFSQKLAVHFRARLPFNSKTRYNPDLLKYVGYFDLELHLVPIERRLFLDVIVAKGATWGKTGSLQADLSFQPWKKGNQYLVVQWFHGFAESLVDYNEKTDMLRIGLMFKPRFYKFY